MTKTEIKFTVEIEGKSSNIRFSIVSNLDERNLSAEAAVENWLVRTKEFTARSFIRYITQKDPFIIAMTEQYYNNQVAKESRSCRKKKK